MRKLQWISFIHRRTVTAAEKPLDGGRTMSRFNTDCLCLECADKERPTLNMKKQFRQNLRKSKRVITIIKG